MSNMFRLAVSRNENMVVFIAGLKRIHNKLHRLMIHCLKEKYYFQNDVDLAREQHRMHTLPYL